MSTRTPAMAAAESTRRKTPAARQYRPQAGDILASERSARADVYTISIVAADIHETLKRYGAAIERVQELARRRRVDGWYTCDHTHFARVANHRS